MFIKILLRKIGFSQFQSGPHAAYYLGRARACDWATTRAHSQHAGAQLALMSPSIWWDNKMILRRVKKLTNKPECRIWLDVGTDEGDERLQDARELRSVLTSKGFTLDR